MRIKCPHESRYADGELGCLISRSGGCEYEGSYPNCPRLFNHEQNAEKERGAALDALADLRTVAEGLAAQFGRGFCEDAYRSGGCRSCESQCDDIREALAAYDAWKKAHP